MFGVFWRECQVLLILSVWVLNIFIFPLILLDLVCARLKLEEVWAFWVLLLSFDRLKKSYIELRANLSTVPRQYPYYSNGCLLNDEIFKNSFCWEEAIFLALCELQKRFPLILLENLFWAFSHLITHMHLSVLTWTLDRHLLKVFRILPRKWPSV